MNRLRFMHKRYIPHLSTAEWRTVVDVGRSMGVTTNLGRIAVDLRSMTTIGMLECYARSMDGTKATLKYVYRIKSKVEEGIPQKYPIDTTPSKVVGLDLDGRTELFGH